MKKSLRYIFILLFLVSVIPLHSQTFSRFMNITPAGKKIVNTKIDNMAYWKRMVKLGYVKADAFVKVPKPVYKSGMISGDRILLQDSPDVPVTSLTNVTQSENSIFVSPVNEDILLNSNNSTDWSGGIATVLYGADDLNSSDAAATWGGEILGAAGTNSGDPTTAIALNGRWYVGMINNYSGQSVAYSSNEGASWTEVVVSTVPGSGSNMLDKNHLWIDNKSSSLYQGYLYDAWTNFVTGSPNENNIELSRSANNGLAWSTPLNISAAVNAGSHNQGVNIHSGPNGEVYVTWAIYDGWPTDESAIGFARSTDGGALFEPAVRVINNIRGIRNSGTSKDMRVNSFPSMAVDVSGGGNNGNIYIVWANHGFPGINTGNDIDVYMIRSTNGGNTWSTPIKVNQDPAGLGKTHYSAWISCDPDNGNLSVIYYDDRNLTSSTQCETWVSNSYDGGDSWDDVRVSDVAFTPMPISGLAMGYFGDYLGITSKNMKVYPVWTDNRTGYAMTYVSPFNMGPPPNQPYVVYNSSDLVTFSGHSGQTMNFGDSLQMSIGLKNIGDRPVSNITAYLSSTSPYVVVTDSSAFYGHFNAGEIKVIPTGYSIKISDTIPDGLMVRFNMRCTDGDSTWYSHFSLEAHAPNLFVNQLTILDSISGNNNHGLDPGETVTMVVNISNTSDFPCPRTSGKLTTNSQYLTILPDSVYLDTIQAGQSVNASFPATVNDEATVGTGVSLIFKAISELYHKTKPFQQTIGIVDEDWETHAFNKFPWVMGGLVGWVITDVDPWQGDYCAKSGLIYDQQSSDIKITYTSSVDDTISFYRKTSSEPSYDFLYFFIDNVLFGSWSGQLPWQRVAFPVPAGTHLFRWSYTKDVFLSVGEDCAWIDYIEFPPPVLPQVYAGRYDTICAGQTYQLHGTAENYDSLQWTTSGDGIFSNSSIPEPVYTPGNNDIINGSVKLKLTGYGTSGSAPSHMYLTISAIPTAQISGQYTICRGQTSSLNIQLTGSSPWKLIMNPIDTVNITTSPYQYRVSPSATTSYSIATVSGLHGCTGSASGSGIITVHPSPITHITASPNDTLCSWQSLTLSSNASNAESFLWTPLNLTTADITVGMTSLGSPGSYWIKLNTYNAFNCSAQDSILIHFKDCVGFDDQTPSFLCDIYPNPNDGIFTLDLFSKKSENIDFKLLNDLNIPVYSQQKLIISGLVKKSFDFRNLPSGIYFLELNRKEGKITYKVVIQK